MGKKGQAGVNSENTNNEVNETTGGNQNAPKGKKPKKTYQ